MRAPIHYNARLFLSCRTKKKKKKERKGDWSEESRLFWRRPGPRRRVSEKTDENLCLAHKRKPVTLTFGDCIGASWTTTTMWEPKEASNNAASGRADTRILGAATREGRISRVATSTSLFAKPTGKAGII